ncbi:MAG TPA: hemolysin family protein [Phycicoccus sp.]|jgi:CBS domain containing-hemolysin-like protein|nr:hemolysin family protein [Phycicoccus sp.]HQH06343.1 hemolysin family protein [Phycicoccus sp.]HQK31556.1 hemolysin family protein [Phycicoccus sp.]HQV91551.1 hemolysin family protein [Phycicoccus sp.]HQY96069.1 hemolysin family protein [Phycicoccus sp.]
MTEWLALLAGVLLTAGTALFVAGEFSLVALDRPTVEDAVRRGEPRADSVLRSLRRLSTQLSGSQVGITVTTLALGFVTTPALAGLLAQPLRAAGLSSGVASSAASVLSLVLVTIFSMIFGELVPQFLGFSAPLRTAKVVAAPLRWWTTAAHPFIVVLNGSANTFLRGVGVEPQEELSVARSSAELASLVRTSLEAGTLPESTARLLTASIGFGSQTAADVMTPRSRATAIERTASAADVVALARSTGHSRFPVLGEDWDDVEGVVHVKKAVAVPYERRADVPVSALMVDHLSVPETLRLDPLLRELRAAGLQFAAVVDEYGGTSGVVTLEDVVEELVGDVSDEHDRGQTTGRRLPDGSWSVPGLWRPDEVRARVGAAIPDGTAYETIGGWVMATLDRVPEVGDEVTVDGWTVRVQDMEGRRVDRVRLRRIAADGTESVGAPGLADLQGAPVDGTVR